MFYTGILFKSIVQGFVAAYHSFSAAIHTFEYLIAVAAKAETRIQQQPA
jgi:hypothetical protein